jgi:hypothetical protein
MKENYVWKTKHHQFSETAPGIQGNKKRKKDEREELWQEGKQPSLDNFVYLPIQFPF